MRTAARLSSLLFFVFLLTASREPPWGDAQITYDTARAMVDRHELQIFTEVPRYFYTVHDGRRYGPGALGNAVAHVPSYLAFTALRHIPGVPEFALYALTSHLSSAALMAIACGIFFWLCRRQGAGERLAALMTLVLGLSTICFFYARSPYSEALQTAALLFFVERVLAQGRSMSRAGMATLGLAAGVLLNAKLVYAIVLPIACVFLIVARRHQPRPDWKDSASKAAAALLAFAPFVALAVAHNVIKTGAPFQTGYDEGKAMFSGELMPALYGFLFSPGKSVFLYSPPLLLGIAGIRHAWRRQRAETALVLSIVVSVTLVSAKYLIWHGGYSWGPRYLAPLTPLVLLLAIPWLSEVVNRGRTWLRRTLLASVVAAGCAVQVLGAAFYPDHFIRMLVTIQAETGGDAWSPDFLPLGYYVPEFSPIVGHAWLLRHVVHNDPDLSRDAPWNLLLTRRFDLSAHWERLRLDWWGLDWFGQPAPAREMGWFLFVLFAGGAATSAAALYDSLRNRTKSWQPRGESAALR